MKKNIACLIIALMVLSLFGTMAGAQISPLPIFGPPISIPFPPGFFDLPPIPRPFFPATYTPGVTKLNLSEAEKAALSNMTPGTCTLVKFALPFFFSDQQLTARSSNPAVTSVTVQPVNTLRICANRKGTALITVATPDGSFSFSFLVTGK